MKIRSLLFMLLTLMPAYGHADEKISLEQFLRDAQEQNLGLKAEEASALAVKAGSAGIAIPAPMVGLTQMKDQSGKANNLEFSQSIPFPTKLTSDHNARQYMAEAGKASQSAKERETQAEAKLLYFKLWKAQERSALLREKKSVIEQHLKLSRAATRSDSFLKIHLIKAESDLDLLQNELAQAEQESRERQIEAADFLNRDPNTYRPVAAEFPLAPLPKEETLLRPSQLEVSRLNLEALKSREGEAKSSWLPDFSLRYRKMGGTMMNPRYSEVMVGASLPFIFFWEPNAASGKAAAERQQGEYLFAQASRKVESQRATLLSRATSLKKQIDQFKESLIPRAAKRMGLVHNLAPRDMDTLQDHRETMEAFPELKLKMLDLREQYEEAVAELTKLASGDEK